MATSATAPIRDNRTRSSDLASLSPVSKMPTVAGLYRLSTLRGGSRAELISADDGYSYVVKSIANPQGRRTLINEWIATSLFRVCGISTAAQSPVTVSGHLLVELRADSESGRWWPAHGSFLHFGSRLPVDPNEQAVYDGLPDQMLRTLANFEDFAGSLVLDTWLGNVDARQVVYYRGPVERLAGRPRQNKNKLGMIAVMIDHGQCFNGASWDLSHCPPIKPFQRSLVYSGVRGVHDFAPWLDAIAAISRDDLEDLRLTIPKEWLQDDEAHLDQLFEELMRRKAPLPHLLSETRENYPSFFPDW